LIYDYIILGGGASGLSLAYKMKNSFFDNKKILILEQDQKNSNDRTWCSWTLPDDPLNEIAVKKWNSLDFFANDGNHLKLDPLPYIYRMIRSKDFYKYTIDELNTRRNVDFIQDKVLSIKEDDGNVTIQGLSSEYRGKHVFKSYMDIQIDKKRCLYVDQHFKGFIIKTEYDVFNPESATFMDFRINQMGETRFMYLLPTSSKEALIELAIFSNEILQQGDYDSILHDYILKTLRIEQYSILEEEFGIIPMTSYNFKKHDTKYITHIGTAGGCVKSSSGYAFDRIQEHTDAIINCLVNGINPQKAQDIFTSKYKLFDATLLDVLLKNKLSGNDFFYQLFKVNKASVVFDFLNERTSFAEEFKIMKGSDKIKFTASLLSLIPHIFFDKDL
jgi:lycopene beta-cyclase